MKQQQNQKVQKKQRTITQTLNLKIRPDDLLNELLGGFLVYGIITAFINDV